jgi:L-aspartate oxidase
MAAPRFDVLIVGSGAAGLSAALKLANRFKVAVLSKGALSDGATAWAQGGIAAVLSRGDSIASHIRDTIRAGTGLCKPATVRFVVEHGPRAVERLIAAGVPFSREARPEDGFGFHLTREGGHSHRRIIHAADATGKAVQDTLEARARRHKNIMIFERFDAIDLITSRHREQRGGANRCHGVYALDVGKRRVRRVLANVTVLATGGASKVYLYTSNPDGATGDGIAMAWRAGCRIVNMEFNQFHPTCLYHPRAKPFLISEALRGEGAKLLLPDGERFMKRFHKDAELAPRDVVARAIDHEMKRLGLDCVYLDIHHKGRPFITRHFPNIYKRCRAFGFDPAKEPIPVVPAAHYTCGGVKTDLKARTDLAGLYAIGEVASTGLHGANRMASNSLLECLVFAEAAASDIEARFAAFPPPPPIKPWDESRVSDSDEMVVVSHNWNELRHFMWDYVGIVRTTKRMERARRRIQMLIHEVDDYYGNFRVTRDLLELRNLVTVANLMVESAVRRKESRGLHYTTDYPKPLKTARDTVLRLRRARQ